MDWRYGLFGAVVVPFTPAAGGPPSPAGDRTVARGDQTIAFRDLIMGFKASRSLADLPACVVRAGFDDPGLPVAVQPAGPDYPEARAPGAAERFHGLMGTVQGRRAELSPAGAEP